MIIRVTGADIETTGLEQEKGHKIIEMAFMLYSYNTDNGDIKGLGKYIQRVYPDHPISSKSQAVHGISIDDLTGEPLWEDEVADKVAKILKQTDLFVAHNVDFDATFLSAELARVDKMVPDIETFCTMKEGRFAKYDGSVPSLRALCECFDISYDLTAAHAAEYDISQTMKCFFLGLKQGYFKLPVIFTETKEAA